jgi:hypothetical protein
MRATRRLSAVCGVVLTVVLRAELLEACSCAWTCFGRDCPGGCVIDLPAECGCICSGSICDYRCRGTGSLQCREANEQGFCAISGPAGPACEGAEAALVDGWVVVEYWTDGQTPATAGDLRALAASSPSFAASAVPAFLARLNRDIEAGRAIEARAATPRPPASPLRHVALYYSARALGTRVAPSIVLQTPVAPSTIAPGTRAYIKGHADSTGRVTQIEVLYAPGPGGDRLAQWIPQVLRVWSEGVPLEFAGYVGVFSDGRLGYVLTAYRADGTRP